jgi:hypothetical protein
MACRNTHHTRDIYIQEHWRSPVASAMACAWAGGTIDCRSDACMHTLAPAHSQGHGQERRCGACARARAVALLCTKHARAWAQTQASAHRPATHTRGAPCTRAHAITRARIATHAREDATEVWFFFPHAGFVQQHIAHCLRNFDMCTQAMKTAQAQRTRKSALRHKRTLQWCFGQQTHTQRMEQITAHPVYDGVAQKHACIQHIRTRTRLPSQRRRAALQTLRPPGCLQVLPAVACLGPQRWRARGASRASE